MAHAEQLADRIHGDALLVKCLRLRLAESRTSLGQGAEVIADHLNDHWSILRSRDLAVGKPLRPLLLDALGVSEDRPVSFEIGLYGLDEVVECDHYVIFSGHARSVDLRSLLRNNY